MTSRDIIKAVLEFNNPPRIGMNLYQPYPNDFLVSWRRSRPHLELEPLGNEVRRWRDEWNITWASLTPFDKGEVAVPAIDDWDQLDDYVPPDLGCAEDYAETAAAFRADKEHYRLGHIPGFTFNVARKLRKLENYLCDLVSERTKTAELHDRVRRELLKSIDRLAEAGADGIRFCEDWGTQNALMISPGMWRDLFLPEYRTLVGRIKEHGMTVFMHSCGKMTCIIEELIASGVDCLMFDQPRLHGIALLAKNFGGRVTFFCPVDIQSTLQMKNPELIRQDARTMVNLLGGFGGGFIADHYTGIEAIGLSKETQDVACEAFVEFGIQAGGRQSAPDPAGKPRT